MTQIFQKAEAEMYAEKDNDATRMKKHIAKIKQVHAQLGEKSRGPYGDEEDDEEEEVPVAGADEGKEEQPPEHRTCTECGSDAYNAAFLEAFGHTVCNSCKDEQFPMVTKSTAKEKYLCTDKQLGTLKFISRKNPQKPTWAAMILFLRADVEKFMEEKFGDEEGLEAEKKKRSLKQLEQRIAKVNKRKAPPKVSTSKKKALLASTLVHEHRFVVDGDTQKCEECGMEVEFEEL
jgi:DNA repair protein